MSDNNNSTPLKTFAQIIGSELKVITSSYSIMLVLIGGIIVYGFLYNLMYAPNLVRDMPIVVVDDSQSALSREYSRLLDAAPQVKIESNILGMEEAKDMLSHNKIEGIVYLPKDFETRVKRGEQSTFATYGTTDVFLYYLALQESSAGAMLELNDRYRANMAVFLPREDVQRIAQTPTANVVGTALYNHTSGYGSYLIPAALMIIMFQTLMMVIGMVGGEERRTGSILLFDTGKITFGRIAKVVLSKTAVYFTLYSIFALFLLGLMPLIFPLPNIGNPLDIAVMITPFLLSTCFLAMAMTVFYGDSEVPLLVITFFSVGLIFLSGVSFPLELMPVWWQWAHYIFPVTPATLAYVEITAMGATISDIAPQYITLWIQWSLFSISLCSIRSKH